MHKKFLLYLTFILISPMTSYAMPIIDFTGSRFAAPSADKYYDAMSDTFTVNTSLSGFGSRLLNYAGPGTGTGITDYNASLSANIDKFGVLRGGTFSITGGITSLGISTGTTLLAGNVSGFELRTSRTRNPTDPVALFYMRLSLDITSRADAIGFDSDQALWDLNFMPLPGAPDTIANLFTADWGPQGAALNDYLYEAVPVSEPSSLALLGIGLLGLGFLQRKHRQ